MLLYLVSSPASCVFPCVFSLLDPCQIHVAARCVGHTERRELLGESVSMPLLAYVKRKLRVADGRAGTAAGSLGGEADKVYRDSSVSCGKSWRAVRGERVTRGMMRLALSTSTSSTACLDKVS